MATSCIFDSMPERMIFPSSPSRAKAVLPIGLIAISFASIFIKICDAPPLIIAAYRLGLATLALLLFTLPRTIDEFLQLRRPEILASFLAGIFLCLHFAFWITSLKYTSVASSVILVTTNPIFVALASTFFLQERISLTLLLSILLAVLGGVIIAWGDWNQGQGNLYGDFLALLGAMMASGYLLVGRRLRQKMGLSAYITLVYGVAAIFLIFIALARGESFFPYSPKTYLLFFLLAFVPQLIGHTTLNWALKYFSATWVAVLILGEPVGATILAYFLLEEPLTHKLLWGGILVLLGIYFSAREERKLGKL